MGKKLRVGWREQSLLWLFSALVLQISPNPSAFCTALIACKAFYGPFGPQIAITAAGLRLTRGTKQRVMDSTLTLPSDVQDGTRAFLPPGCSWDRSGTGAGGTSLWHRFCTGERQQLQGMRSHTPEICCPVGSPESLDHPDKSIQMCL